MYSRKNDSADDDSDIVLHEESSRHFIQHPKNIRLTIYSKKSSKDRDKVSNLNSFKGKLSIKEKNRIHHAVISACGCNSKNDDEPMDVDRPEETRNIFILTEEIFVVVFEYLDQVDQLNFILASKRFMCIVGSSSTILRRFTLKVDQISLEKLTSCEELTSIPFKNVELNLESSSKLKDIKIFFMKIKKSVENLIMKRGNFKSLKELFEIVGNISNLQALTFDECNIECFGNEHLSPILSLKSISMIKCNNDVYKVLMYQTTIEKIMVRNDEWTWNGFPHDVFNEIARKSRETLREIVLKGVGTGSYFDSDEFPYKIQKLDTEMITYHWYVGIRTERVSFLKSQLGSLKELTFNSLPNDFDGGRVLKYIFDNMNLQKLCYGNTVLILNGQKQQVKMVGVSEIQIQSLIELVRQFPSITKLCLTLSATDIASDEIEKVVNPSTNLFKNIQELEVIDNSKYRGTLGVFLGLFKNLQNVRKLTFKSPDRNINTILEECLPHMPQLNEIYLTSETKRFMERFSIIKNFATHLNKISVVSQYVDEAKKVFGDNVEVCIIKNN